MIGMRAADCWRRLHALGLTQALRQTHMTLIDDILNEAMKRGDFDNLSGAGKPLQLDDDSHTPAHLRLAHKLLKDNDLVPDWIAQGQALDAAFAALERDLRTAARRSADPSVELRARVEALNREILSYNLKIPRGLAHKRMIDLARVWSTAQRAE